jgi:hypothetical protein
LKNFDDFEDGYEEVEDEDWNPGSKLSREERKKKSQEKWEESKKDWKELTEEFYENKLEGKWVQKGPYLYKKDAKLEFATYIGNDYVLTGIDENGQPMLKKKH